MRLENWAYDAVARISGGAGKLLVLALHERGVTDLADPLQIRAVAA